ncbi:MAG: 50S ribosomal protein L15 [Candidatus Staskawiczbacteria bacterium]|nr:50S ribosomal protein L15 [Candidatus Staskawiczbacteria bacterium]
MQLHELKRKHKNRDKKRVGRGGKHGSYSGKGIKGQSSRAGRKMEPIVRALIKRYPKLKGYKSFRFETDFSVINLDVLEKKTKDGEIINPENLIKKGLISKIKGRSPKIKILGTGKLTKKLVIENCRVSKTAKDAIEKAGGSVKQIVVAAK